MIAVDLKTEHMREPMGIDIAKPYLSWTCDGGVKQTAYEIEAEINGFPSWQSGKVLANTMHTTLNTEMSSRARVRWRIRLWDETDTPGSWSEAHFEMGLLQQADFQAKWIDPELERDPKEHKPASYLRRRFTVEQLGAARLYVTAHGLYEVILNGQRVGDFVLAPGTSSYDKVISYQTYDVTDLLRMGENEVQVILGDGWYRSCSGVDGDRNLYGEDVALWFQLEVDGVPVCLSDESWEASQEGPLRMDDMQQGETVDNRITEITGWHSVKVADFRTDTLACSNSLPIVEKERFSGKLITAPNGETVIDYGQNLAGYVEFTVFAHEGDTITLTHGEALDENGNFTAENFQDRKRHKEGGTEQRVHLICREGENHYGSVDKVIV